MFLHCELNDRMELNLSHRTHWKVRPIRVATKRKGKDQSDDSRRDVRRWMGKRWREVNVPSEVRKSRCARPLINFMTLETWFVFISLTNLFVKTLRMKLMFFSTRFIEELTFLFDHYKLKDTIRSFIHRLIPWVRRDLCMPVTRMRTLWRWCSSMATRMLIRQGSIINKERKRNKARVNVLFGRRS